MTAHETAHDRGAAIVVQPDEGFVMYGRPRCCKGKTDLKRR